MPTFPPVPFEAVLSDGATAYNTPDGIPWGKTPAGACTVGSVWRGYARIDAPKYPNNGKSFWVRDHFITPTDPDPPDPPDPDPDPTTPPAAVEITLTTLYADGDMTVESFVSPPTGEE